MTEPDMIEHWQKGAKDELESAKISFHPRYMKRTIPGRAEGLQKAKLLKEMLIGADVPVQHIFLYGSVARNNAHEWSDIDIAVFCTPFRKTRHEENMEVRRMRREIDIRIEPICLHPEDIQNRYFGLPKEIQRTGVEV